jgi:hypothetical protein
MIPGATTLATPAASEPFKKFRLAGTVCSSFSFI